MYKMLYGDRFLFDPFDDERIVGDAKLTNNINAASYLDFTIYPGHPLYDVIEERSETVRLWWDNEELFKGQIYKIDIGMEGLKSVSCNSALEHLKDVQLRPYSTDAVECEEYEYPLDKAPDTLAGYFQWVIDQYNELNLTDTRFSVHVNQADYLTDRTVYFSSTSAQTVADAIDQNILGSYGGYLSLRYKDDELMLDLYSDIHEMNPQIIDFGENILDITKAEDTTDQYTAIYPTGYTPQYTKEQQKYHDEKAIYDQTMEDRDNAQRAKIDKLKREEDAEQRRIDGMPKGEAKTNAQNALKRRKEQREAQEKSFQQETERLRDQQRVKDDKNSADKTKPNPITIESLPDGGYSGDLDILKRGDVIYSASAVERYGYKEYAYSESDVEDKEVLLRLAVAKLKTLMAPVTTVVVRAVDQATYHAEHTHLFVGQAVRVRSKIQHVDEYMMVSSIELDLNDPSRTTATLGVAYDTLTGQQSSYLKNLNSQIVASVDEVKKVSEDVKTTEITIGKLENAVVENKEQHDILVNTVESSQWVSNTAYDNAQEASEAADKANEDIQEVNTTLDEHNAKLEALDESAKAMDGKIKETEEKAQNAVASIETLRTDVETDIQGVRDDVAAVSDKADTIKAEANKAIEGVKESVNAVSDRAEVIKAEANKAIEGVKESVNAVSNKADAINTAANSAIAGVRNEVQNVKTSAENANIKANKLQQSLDDANAVIETHTTKLGGLETTLSNTTQTAESALSVASSAKLEAGQVKITANSAYSDAQSALTKTSELKSDIDGLSLNLSNNYYGKGDADALFATNASLQATSNGIKTEVSKTYATKESVDTLQNIADNAIESWTGTTVPTASNAPANTWTTKELKKRHSGDIYYNMSTGKSYRWGSTDGNTYSWTMIADNDITKALADAAKAQQTADGAKTDVVNLSNNVKATYASKADLEITSDEIKQEVSAVSSTANTNKTDIANLKLRADGLETNFQSTSNTLKGHTEAIGRLEVKADGLSANFSSLSDLTEEAMANAEEKVTNGGFESGDYGWYTSPVVENFTQQTPYAHSGNRQMIFDRRTKELLQKVVRSTSVVSGRRYRFGVWYRTIDGTKNAGISGGLRLQQSSDGSNFRDWRSVDIPVAHLTGPADWKYIYVDGIPDDSVKFIRARVAFTGAPSLALDDVSIKDITDAYEAITKTSEIRSDLDGFKQTASQIYETKDASSQKIQEVKTSVDGLTSTVSSVSTTANSALEKSTKLEQSVDGFKSEVSKTYATKNELSDELKNTAKSYNIDKGFGRWNNIGRIVIPQQGKNAVLDFSYGSGYNGMNTQQSSVRVELRTSNRSSTSPDPNRISATITRLLRATNFSMKIYYEGGDTYNLWVRDGATYTRGTVTVYGVVDFTVIDQMVAEGVNDPTDTGTEQTSIGEQVLTNTTYVDQTSERIALNSIRNYRDADGNTLVNSGQLAISANQIKSEVAQTYTTKNEFNNLKIGGRNLLLNTKTSKQIVGNNGINQTMTLYTLSTHSWAHLDPGEYMISADISYEGIISGKFAFLRNGTPWGFTTRTGKNFEDIITDDKRKAHVEFLVTNAYNGATNGLAVRFDNVQGTVTFSNMKLEKGNKATTWSPAPEDMVSKTEAETTYTTKSEFTQEKDKITLSVSEAATTANSALSKANALEVTAGKLQSTISEHATSISGNTTNISKLTQTANSLTSELSQVSNIADIAYNKTDNLIIDGGFEGGTKTWPNIARAGWRFTDGTRRTGSYAVRKEVSTTIGTLYLTHKPTECIDTQGSIAGRPLDLIPGRVYRFSCWVYPTNGAAGAPDKCKVRIGAAPNGSHIWSKAFNTFPQNTWTELTFDYTATAENPRIFLNVQCDNTAGIYCFDDFSFRDVTEALKAQKTADSGIEKTSKLEQTLDGFKTTVSQTYLPKTDFDNLKIGGRNLAVYNQLTNYNSTNFSYDQSTNTYTMVAPVGTSTWGYGARIKRNDASINRHNVLVPWGMTIIKSFEAYSPVDAQISSDFDLYPVTGGIWNSNDNDLGSSRSPQRVSIKGGEWTKVWWRTTNADPRNTNKVDLVDNSNFGLVTSGFTQPTEWKIRNFKAELGNIPTDWTPAPEDMVSQTEAETTYTTKSEFTQEKDKITLSVSEAATTANSALSKANTLEQTAGQLQSSISEQAKTISGHTTSINTLTQTASSLSSQITQVGTVANMGLLQADDYIIDGSFEKKQETWPGVQLPGNGQNPGGFRFSDNTFNSGKTCLVADSGTGSIKQLYLTHKPDKCIGDDAVRYISVLPGHVYRLSGYIMKDRNYTASDPANDKIRIGNDKGSLVADYPFSSIKQTGSFVKFEMDIVPNSDQGLLSIAIRTTGTNAWIAFDDLSFRDVTEAKAAQTTANDAISRYSTLKQDLDGFKTTVGQTYETKTDALSKKSSLETTINSFKTEVSTTYAKQTALTTVSDKLDNLKIGGRNLLLNTKISKQMVGNNVSNQGTTLYTLSTHSWAHLDPGDYMISADISYEGTISGKFAFQRDNKPWGFTPAAGKNFADIITDSKRKAHVEFCVTNAYDGATKGLGVRFDNVQGTVTFSNMKLEKGNKATAWTPAPEDMATALELSEQKSYIDQQDSKIELGVKNTYQTKADMAGYAKTADVESKISASKSGILLEVSNKYASKELPQQLIDNLKVGDTNLLQRTQWLDRTGVSASETGYMNVTPASYDSTNYLGKFKVGKVTSSGNVLLQYSIMDVEPNTDYVFSWYGKGTSNINAYFYGPTGYIKAIAVDYSDGMSFVNNAYADGKISFQMTSEWKRYWVHWKTAETMNGATTKQKYVLLRDDSNVRDAYAAAPKLEKGTKPTEWSPSPWDLGDAQTLREQGTKIEQNANNIALKVSTKDLAFGDNIWPNQWCEPSTADNPRYQIGSPYTGTEAAPSGGKIFQLNSRDHYNGDFPLRMPSRLRIIVEAKRIAGTRNLNAGIWRKQRTEGNAWSYVGVTKREDLTNGWQRLTYDINNNSGRVGALYFQIDQSGSSPDTTWLISNIRFYDITDSEELNTKIDVRADAITSEVSQKINDISIGSRNLMKLAWMGPYTNNTTWNYSNYFQDGGFSFTRTNSRDGGVYMDNYQGVQANKEYIVHFQLRVKEGNVSKIYIYVGLNGTTNNTPETGLFIDGVRKGNGGVDIPFTPVLNQWYDIEYRYRTSASSVNKATWNGHIIQLNKNESSVNYTAEVRGFMWEEGNKPTGWNPAPEDMASSSMVVQTKDAITTTITQQVNTINQSINQTNANLNSTNQAVSTINGNVNTVTQNVNTLQTYITQKSEGILVGKNVNGKPTGYIARVNSMGSFDILDSSRNNRVIASMGTDGLEYRKYYDNNYMPADAYTNWTIGFQTVQSGPQTTFMLPDLKFPIGTAFNSWPGNGTAWNIVRDRFQQPGTVYRAQNIGGNGFCCYDSSYNNTTYGIYSSADVVPQQGVKFVNVSAIRKILETKTGSYAGYDYESWKYFLYSCGLFLSTHNDSSDPNATPTPGSTNFKSVVLMSPGIYLISAIVDIRQPTSGTILGDVWFQWNFNGGINDWKPVYGCPIYTALWNGGQDSGGDKPGHWVRSTIPATVVRVNIPCIRVALRLPPDIEVGSRTQMNIVRLPFSHSYDI